MNGDKMRVAEYMRIEESPAKLYRLPDGTSARGPRNSMAPARSAGR
jgi:hypothetical protein